MTSAASCTTRGGALYTLYFLAMGLFGKPTRQSVALIDVGSASVGGAFAHFEASEQPTVYYTARVPLERREGESAADSMLRSLGILSNILVNGGAPVLRSETGNAHIDAVVVSISAPWQETSVRVERVEDEHPFVFTHALMEQVTRRGLKEHPERVRTGESVISSILNGYEVENPFGKKTKRADLVILSSTLERTVASAVQKVLRQAFHTADITFTAFAPLSYAVLRDLYPHEKDFLILEVEGEQTDLAFVKHGLLTDIASLPQGTNALLQAVSSVSHPELMQTGDTERGLIDAKRNEAFASEISKVKEEWLASLTSALKGFAGRHALPRTIFLLADADARGFLEGLLDTPSIHALWLSDEPLGIIAMSPLHLSQHVRTRGKARGDVFLAMMALYFDKKMKPLPGE